jgi:hypothetical protein
LNPRQALAASLQLFAVFTFFGIGFFLVCLPFAPEVRILFSHAIVHRPDLCTLLGVGFFGAAFLLLIGFYGLNRGRFLSLRMGRHWMEIDAEIVRRTVEPLLKSQRIALEEVEILRGRDLEFGVRLTELTEAEQETALAEAEKQLSILLKERFGYSRPFTLVAKTT